MALIETAAGSCLSHGLQLNRRHLSLGAERQLKVKMMKNFCRLGLAARGRIGPAQSQFHIRPQRMALLFKIRGGPLRRVLRHQSIRVEQRSIMNEERVRILLLEE